MKLMLPESLCDALEQDSEDFGFASLQALIEEVIRLQYPVWRVQRILYEQQRAPDHDQGKEMRRPLLKKGAK